MIRRETINLARRITFCRIIVRVVTLVNQWFSSLSRFCYDVTLVQSFVCLLYMLARRYAEAECTPNYDRHKKRWIPSTMNVSIIVVSLILNWPNQFAILKTLYCERLFSFVLKKTANILYYDFRENASPIAVDWNVNVIRWGNPTLKDRVLPSYGGLIE